jgi:hypothetical protein
MEMVADYQARKAQEHLRSERAKSSRRSRSARPASFLERRGW